jgi:predicted acetyltransferase
MPPTPLKITKIGPEAEQVMRNLLEHYLHDMSEWFHLDTHPDGSFSYDTSLLWQPDRDVYLVRSDDALAGFAIIGKAGRWLGEGAADVHDVHEFFVLRRYRRDGIGWTVAERLWNQRPGPWLVRVAVANAPAVAFWRAAINGYTGGDFTEEPREANGRQWSYFRFESPGG